MGILDFLESSGAAGVNAGVTLYEGEENRDFIAKQNSIARGDAIAMTKLGNALDLHNQKEMYDYRIDQGLAAGLTPYEAYLGPAGGAGGGTTGSGTVLGNQPGKAAVNATAGANAQLAARTSLANSIINQMGNIATAKIGAETSKEVAGISAGATKYSADQSASASQYQAELQYKIRHKELVLNRERFNKIDLPMAVENVGKTKQETLKLINETITSAPEYVTMLKRLQMGPQNVLVEYAINNYGFNPLDEKSVQNATREQKRHFLGLVLGSQSVAVRELFGASLATGTTFGQARDTLGNAYEEYMNKFGFDKKGNLLTQ